MDYGRSVEADVATLSEAAPFANGNDQKSLREWFMAIEAGIEAHERFSARVDDVLDKERDRASGCPIDTIIGRIAAADIEGAPLDRAEVRSIVSILLVGGSETGDRAMANMWWNLLQNPDQYRAVRADPLLWQNVFAETLRKDPPGLYFPRQTTREVEICGVTIPANADVLLSTGAANRDPRVFSDPDTLDIFRTDLDMGIPHHNGGVRQSPAGPVVTHTAFGAGQHFCPGNQLARLQATIGCRILDEALGELELAGPLPAMTHHGNLRSITTLRRRYKLSTAVSSAQHSYG